MAYLFPGLSIDGFWHLEANPGFDANVDYNVFSMVKFRQNHAGSRIDEELFFLMLDLGIKT